MEKTMLRKAAAFFSLIFLCIQLNAQNVNLSGKVVDSSGEPVIGASVVLVGNTTVGAITDLNGNYNLTVPSNSSITVSFIGYQSQTVAIGGRSVINFTLVEDNEFLEETVVIGYGVQRKSDITGAIASVKSEALENRSITDAAQALQGKAAGVQILNSTGAPGKESQIQIRGYSSNSKNSPLIIVDGLKVRSMSYLDPDNIESMEILKDAASAAIYGIEAGNGVILITTKSGKNTGNGRIFYNYQYTSQKIHHLPKMLGAKEYLQYQNTLDPTMTPESMEYDGVTDTDWPALSFEKGLMQRHTVGFQGGNENGNLYASLTYLDNNGIIVGDKDIQKRLTGQINAEYKIKRWMTVGANISIEKSKSRSVSEGANTGASMIGSIIMLDPITPWTYTGALPARVQTMVDQGLDLMKDPDGYIYGISAFSSNSLIYHPIFQRDKSDSESNVFNIRGTAYANFTPIKGLTFTSRLGFRSGYSNSQTFNYELYITPLVNNDLGLSGSINDNIFYQWENFANYTFDIGKSNFTLMAGMSYEHSSSNSINASGTELNDTAPNFRWISQLKNNSQLSVGGQPSESANMSYYGRIGWSYDRRYNLQASFRADAYDTSKLDPSHRWGYFPSVSAGWNISNEPFMSGVNKNVLSNLRLRTSWGINGNVNSVGSYQYATTMSLSSRGYNFGNDMTTWHDSASPSSRLANPQLSWETSHQFDVGLEGRMFSDKLTFEFDWYDKRTHDLITSMTAPGHTGASSMYINAGKVLNTGFEAMLSWKDNIGDFSYGINLNGATLKNKVLEGTSKERVQGQRVWQSDYVTYFEEGYPLWYLRTYLMDSIDPQTGVAVYKDFDGDGSITQDDRDYVGKGIPDLTYGVTVNLGWKGFDLTIYGAGAQGIEKLFCLQRGDFREANTLKYFWDNAWAPGKTNYIFPKPNKLDTFYIASDAMVFDASFFKIKQIQLGYNLPQSILRRIKMSQLRAYVSLDDWFVFTKYPGMDPETNGYSSNINSMALDTGTYPMAKKVVFGVNLSF